MVIWCCVALAGCGSPELASSPKPTATSETLGQTPIPGSPTSPARAVEPCASGELLVGDLPQIDRLWREGLTAAESNAREWQQDAVLSNLRVVCQLFERAFRWQATFYSRNAQAFYSSDTGEVTPSSIEPPNVPILDAEAFSFALVHRALKQAGYDDATEISPSSGVDIRLNTIAVPFGPPEAPDGVILYHVAIESRGEIKDLFVDGRDGSIYTYQ
jgi:hypothetical protein